MPDYAAMYQILFNSQAKAIEILQQALQEAEELYISGTEHKFDKVDDSLDITK